tara:strand:- start:443 stop:901 length:459 start_codon:yes stop_codon:yes gene_type:complete
VQNAQKKEGKMKVENGNTVSVHYRGTLDDGMEFDNSYDREMPLEFQVGEGRVIGGFDSALLGMQVGEVKNVTIEPDNAYGPIDEQAVATVPRTQFPEEMEFAVGGVVQAQNETGTFRGVISSFTDEEAVIDFNHPLAGKTLNFEIELVDIQE